MTGEEVTFSIDFEDSHASAEKLARELQTELTASIENTRTLT